MAVGLSLPSENIELFRKRINEYADSQNMPFDRLNIDCKLNPASISVDLVRSLLHLQPYGAGNPAGFRLLQYDARQYNSIIE